MGCSSLRRRWASLSALHGFHGPSTDGAEAAGEAAEGEGGDGGGFWRRSGTKAEGSRVKTLSLVHGSPH